MADPNMALYPSWIKHCEEMIQHIQSGERNRVDLQYSYTPTDDLRDIAYYKNRIKKYELAMKGEWE